MTREEAIKIVKNNWPDGRHQIAEALRFLIPELSESEDEKIRKLIIESIKGNMSVGSDKQKAKAIDWLERQKSLQLTKQDAATLKYAIEDIRGLMKEETIEQCIDLYAREISLLEKIKASAVLPSGIHLGKGDMVAIDDALWCVGQASKYAKNEQEMGICWCAEQFLKKLKQ